MSHARVRVVSGGESGRALLSGSSACSIRSRSEALFSTCCCCPPRARKRAPRTELGVTIAVPKAKTAIATVTNTTTPKNKSSMTYLDLYPNNLSDHEISDRLQSDSG